MIRLLLQILSFILNVSGYQATHGKERRLAPFSCKSLLKMLLIPSIYVGRRLYQRVLRHRCKALAAISEQRNERSSAICRLPQELRDEIFSHLPIKSLATAKITCKTLSRSGPSVLRLWHQAVQELDSKFLRVWTLDKNATGAKLIEFSICLVVVMWLWCQLLVPVISLDISRWDVPRCVFKRNHNNTSLNSLRKLLRWAAIFENLCQYALDCGFIQENKVGGSGMSPKSDFSSRLAKFLVCCSSVV